jgi:hypothetical protein
MKQNSCRKRYPSGVCLQEWFEPGRITAPGFVIGTVGWGLCIGSGPEGGAPGQMQASIAFPRFESIDAPINLVLRSAHVILRRACPTWGARLEGLRESRRTATSETEPAAIRARSVPTSAANGLKKSARSAALECYDAACKARRILMPLFLRFVEALNTSVVGPVMGLFGGRRDSLFLNPFK